MQKSRFSLPRLDYRSGQNPNAESMDFDISTTQLVDRSNAASNGEGQNLLNNKLPMKKRYQDTEIQRQIIDKAVQLSMLFRAS